MKPFDHHVNPGRILYPSEALMLADRGSDIRSERLDEREAVRLGGGARRI